MFSQQMAQAQCFHNRWHGRNIFSTDGTGAMFSQQMAQAQTLYYTLTLK